MKKMLLGTGIVFLLVIAGCDTKRKTPVEHFKETHGKTMTPHGRIKLETVKAVDGNRIQYETEDGSVFRVAYDRQGGNFRYKDPEKVK
jgi:hypothetical protein